MRFTRWILLVVAALLVFTSCSSGPDKNVKTQGTSNPQAIQASSKAESSLNPFASPKAIPASVAQKLLERPCEGTLQYSTLTGHPGADYLRATTRPPIRWGPHCEVLSVGDHCGVQWDGSYVVINGDEAYLTFQGWAKGQSKPFKEITAGPLQAEGELHRAEFPVVIPKATEVAFRIVLRNKSMTAVAVSDSYSYPLNCKKETS